MNLYVSAMTQKIHTTRDCSVTRRNHAVNLETTSTAKELAAGGYIGCKRCDAFQVIESAKNYAMIHEHRYTIIVGNAPITMMAGKRLPDTRECACGDQIIIGYYTYDPKG